MEHVKTNTAERILEATYQCMARKGSGSVSTRDIAQEAGVTLSLIHYHFPSKEALLVTAAAQIIQRHLHGFLLTLQPEQSVTERLKQVIAFVRSRFETEDSTWRKVYFDLLAMAAWSPRIADEVKKLQDQIVDLIVAGIPADNMSGNDLAGGARMFLAALNGLALQALHGTSREELDHAYTFLERAILSQFRPPRRD
ncbi:TetR/AcrR family transcriptional regulator [Alicyclobacillus cycloheptanicus]|uniref:AcrR family transcriptional regulator n=1 Tax=Alicyclobacillus cycloheptanicus TaxID=1457 RepID=A0ABT9XLI9_9BACL|nr:TetR/AcrR family transcriptional regulator [Alicyclobacillus cycloheptanicus]MDQ0191172.1 AcrR family transcriptional regulator [Alicyclobacillus cycloheptanicus]WDM02019.1 TetR/AcrR family transcriptional regulator [Alicyclobacillus cycloheptanicus]